MVPDKATLNWVDIDPKCNFIGTVYVDNELEKTSKIVETIAGATIGKVILVMIFHLDAFKIVAASSKLAYYMIDLQYLK